MFRGSTASYKDHLDLVKLVMCTLVSRVHIALYSLFVTSLQTFRCADKGFADKDFADKMLIYFIEREN